MLRRLPCRAGLVPDRQKCIIARGRAYPFPVWYEEYVNRYPKNAPPFAGKRPEGSSLLQTDCPFCLIIGPTIPVHYTQIPLSRRQEQDFDNCERVSFSCLR